MTLEFTVNKPRQKVFEYLTDMQKFVEVHPVIFKMDKINENEYLVYEKLNYIPFPFKYKAVVEGNQAGDKVFIKATVMKIIHIRMSFDLLEMKEETKITENVDFRSFLPVHPVMRSIFRTQHNILFANISKA